MQKCNYVYIGCSLAKSVIDHSYMHSTQVKSKYYIYIALEQYYIWKEELFKYKEHDINTFDIQVLG